MFERTATYTNSTALDEIAWMEPWCEEVIIRPGKTLTFKGCGAEDGEIEIEKRDGGLIVYGWPTSRIDVDCDGIRIWEAYFEVPPIPKGFTASEFVKFLFHKQPPEHPQSS